MPRVSIGLPVFNGDKYLAEALDSLLGQTYGDFELIISDNASTDKTERICRYYAAIDSRIRYYRGEHNQGAAWNYNRVFELSVGEYFKWAAHDDICAPTFLEKCVEILENNSSAVLCYAKTMIIDEYGRQVKNYIDDLHLTSPTPHERFQEFQRSLQTVAERNAIFGVMRRCVLRQSPLIGSYVASDTLLLAELALRGQFHEIPECLFFRRDHAQTSVNAHPKLEARTAWFNTKSKGKVVLPRWRWLYEYVRSIMRVHMRARDRIYCIFEMAKWLRRHCKALIEDLGIAAHQLLGNARQMSS